MVSSSTRKQIFRTVPMIVTDAIVQTAANYLRPPTPPVTDIPTMKKSPVKTLHTVCGKVTKDETPRQVQTKGGTTQVRTIQVKLALWRNFAEESFNMGDYIKVESVTLTEYQQEKQLASTSRTKIEVSSPPEEQVAITIVAFDTTNKDYEFLESKKKQ